MSEPSAIETADASRRRLLWFCFATALVSLFAFYSNTFTSWAGGDGLTLEASTVRYVFNVAEASGAAAAAGIRAGDTIDARTIPLRVRGGKQTSLTHVTVFRDGRPFEAAIVPRVPPILWDELLRSLAEVWCALFAALIAWRAKKWSGGAPLAFILAVFTFGDAINRMFLPGALLTNAAGFIGLEIFSALTFALIASFFATFDGPPAGARRTWTRIAYAASVLSALGVAGHYAAAAVLWIPYAYRNVEFDIFELLMTSPVVPCVVCGVLAARSAAPSERQRIGWVVASFAFFWAFWIAAGPLRGLWGNFSPVVWQIEDAAHILVPVGLTYAALRRRLFDIGFVINRAAVFTVVSALVIGTFVAFEWAAGKWFEGVSHTTSLAINLSLALLLGISLRFVHHRVDGFVDNVFFRKRHENERALRRFAHEATLMTNAASLTERTQAEITAHTDASWARAVLAHALDLDDPAVLALRAWNEPLDLTQYKTALDGERAFPMTAHGQLVGVLICGPKTNEESYAPDEIDAIGAVAHGAGLALWAFQSSQGDDVMREILAELQALRRSVGGAPLTSKP